MNQAAASSTNIPASSAAPAETKAVEVVTPATTTEVRYFLAFLQLSYIKI